MATDIMNVLRRGNCYQDSITKTVLIVDSIDEKNISFKFMGDDIPDAQALPQGWQAVPIDITPAVLEACGFQGVEKSWSGIEFMQWYHSEGFTYHVLNVNYPWWVNGSSTTGRNIKHLHDLQNLFLDITGELLEYKPTSIKLQCNNCKKILAPGLIECEDCNPTEKDLNNG